jgi:transposase
VDTLGLLLNIVVHSAAVQDRDGALLVLNRRTRRFFPFIEFIFADTAYQGPKTAAAIAKTGTWKLAIVKREELHRFLVLPKRWIVGVSSEGHAVMSVKVRPEPKDSGFEAREAPWRESKTAEPSDDMLERSMREASGCNVQ